MKPVVYKFAIPLTVILLGVLTVFWLNQTASSAMRVPSSNATVVVTPELTDAQKAKLEKMTPDEQKAFLAKLQQQNSESSQTTRSSGSGFSGRGGRFGATTSATVETMTIWPDSWSAQVILFGKTFSYQQRNILSRLSSEVTQLEVNAGQRVKTGQLLLKLDDEDLQRSLKQAQNQLSSIDAQIRLQKLQAEADRKSLLIEEKLLAIQEATVKRYENLNNLQLSSSNDYEATLMAYQNQLKSVQSQQLAVARQADEMAQLITQKNEQQLAVEDLQSQLKDATIEAPFDGVIASIAVILGDEVSQGDQLITIYDDSLLGLETKIPVNQLRGLSNADQQIYAFTELAGQPHNLQLSDLDSLASGGAVVAKFRFITPVTITLGEHQAMTVVLPPQNNVFAIPASSLYENKLVYKVEQQQLVDIAVNVTGQTLIDGNTWYIFDSREIKAGDQILVTRLPNASRGLKVSIPVKEAS
ncbi:efflux RND transporter periplasmic adaptor subunit [Gynuella sunshinyii]|uniref:Multidrug resistance efflux pump n=1 Tax=Gynuella sunshinyii YC6258 TaxID=1445510 RepID=A0A0C5VPY3_9GAMM|nr:biotin/lipoyl-binding protein [Gynuella sunshinyii]AJQ92324.1 multidrug resistance efflux pump [Gynuella sunshinyii YC6258]